MVTSGRIVLAAACVIALLASGCAKNVQFRPTPLAGQGKAEVKVELTYDRNNTLIVKMESMPQPESIKPEYTRYVLWAAPPERTSAVNIGQIRVDDKRNATITTLTPLRNFILFITAEATGEVQRPGPDIVFEAPQTEW